MQDIKHFFIFRDFPPQKGGMSTYYYNIVKFLKGKKFVFLPKDYENPPFIENTKYIIAPFKKGMEKNIFFTLIWFFQIFFNLIIKNPNFIHIGKIRPITYFFQIFKIFKKKIIIYFHGLDYYEIRKKSFLKRKIVYYAIKKADLITCANKYVLKLIKKDNKLKRSYILYPGIDISYFENIKNKFEEKKGKEFIILTVANLVKRKNIDNVLRALNLLKGKYDFKYYIIGKGEEEENLKKLVKDLNLSKNVYFLGELGEEKFKYYKICDIFIMPSRFLEEESSFEGFGIVFLEASFFKKFLIGAKTGGIPEAIIDGETGILVKEPENYFEIYEIIKDYFENPLKYKEMREKAYERVIREFDVKKLIENYENFLLKTLK